MRQFNALELRVELPCMENWASMTPNEQGRFCGICSKTVVDFTHFSDEELLDYFRNYTGENLCGRIQKTRTNTILQKPKTISNSLILSTLAGTIFTTTSCSQIENNGWFQEDKPPIFEWNNDQVQKPAAVPENTFTVTVTDVMGCVMAMPIEDTSQLDTGNIVPIRP